jgi:hypothetical protein
MQVICDYCQLEFNTLNRLPINLECGDVIC